MCWLSIFRIVLVLLLFATGQVTQAATPATSADACTLDDACKRLVERALLSSQQKQYAEALQLYQAAFAIQPEPRLLVSIGRMQHKLERWEEARASYQQFLNVSAQPEDEPYRAKAAEWLKEIESRPLQPTPTAPTVSEAHPKAIGVEDSRSTERRPVYKKWWFWTLIGGATAAMGTGLALGLALPRTPPAPQGALVFQRTF